MAAGGRCGRHAAAGQQRRPHHSRAGPALVLTRVPLSSLYDTIPVTRGVGKGCAAPVAEGQPCSDRPALSVHNTGPQARTCTVTHSWAPHTGQDDDHSCPHQPRPWGPAGWTSGSSTRRRTACCGRAACWRRGGYHIANLHDEDADTVFWWELVPVTPRISSRLLLAPSCLGRAARASRRLRAPGWAPLCSSTVLLDVDRAAP